MTTTLTIEGRETPLGGFSVRRVLPYREQRMVGPFIFFDHIGPATFENGQGIDVRPHPHIGLATITYLFDGGMMHRDSLGNELEITPGAVNWMTAGRGICHSERTPDKLRERQSNIHGIQLWVALPVSDEETEPSFSNYAKDDLPIIETDGVWLRLIAGEAFGQSSPVETFSPLYYAHTELKAGATLELPKEHKQHAIYVVNGALTIANQAVAQHHMHIINDGAGTITAKENSTIMLIGGEPFPEERFIWWNFVSSRKERIMQAQEDWEQGRFPNVPGDEEFIPLPKID